ncbi:Cytosolic Fe-S cluster assembly factor [Seminavis robusta]|uniref:Cytosolic Fe-S cluster assembly factor NUBP1 homolog n=1 Tax=Seminavis robusta TaxID=568900 RepID=A0A9N8F0Z3_9STRA|nr:Cytosolic Fe-S cluster assembly factor [Seminavis robusta]|eukprot:Sro2695_g334890.1 Cytosolic Fe-S cluster assembly factor (377) ;mRNA; r:9980-11313
MTETVPTEAHPPANANSECVGPASESAGKNSACQGCPNQSACSTGAFNSPEAKAKAQQETQSLKASLSNVSHVILVLSGKGGVGKSTLAAQLSHTLASQGFAVGLLDVDLCGPSAPRMVLGDAYATSQVHRSGSGAWTPVYASPNLAVMSISFLLEQNNAAVIWRGPRKNALIQQFLTEVDWTGDTDGLDYLIVDTPPGTSDEHISTVQYLQKAGAVSGAVVVTTPEEVSLADVRKELNFCEKTKVPVLGVVENMGSLQTTISKLTFRDPKSGDDKTEDVLKQLQEKCPELLDMVASADLFRVVDNNPQSTKKGAEQMAEQYNVPFWGSLPLDTDLLKCCEQGKPVVEECPNSIASKTLTGFVQRLTKALPVEMGK